MNLSKKIKAVAVFGTVVGLLALTACGGGSGNAVDDASSSPVPTVAPEPTAVPEPTVSPTATPVPPTVTPVPPTAVPTSVPTATLEPPRSLDEFGFSLGLDRGAYVTNLPGNTDAQGMVQLEYSGVNVILSWVPINGVTNEGLVSGMFEMLQGSQPGLTLDTVSESTFNVGLEPGLVIGFKSVDGSGDVAGGGLVGAWNCLDAETSFTITVTGQDASVVQLRFNRLINNFECARG
jgi:hypothetical protein